MFLIDCHNYSFDQSALSAELNINTNKNRSQQQTDLDKMDSTVLRRQRDCGLARIETSIEEVVSPCLRGTRLMDRPSTGNP